MIEMPVVVCGLGGMGSAALARVAMRGVRVLGIEQYAPVHAFGSSSGKSRIIRRAYFEDPAYVPLLDRAYELWRELEARTRAQVLHLTGLLTLGYDGSPMLAGAHAAARAYDMDVEFWDASAIRARYPALAPLDDEHGIFERDGGFVVPERAIEAHLALAKDHGAQTRFGVGMRGWESAPDGVRVTLTNGETIRCEQLILTLGPWFRETLAEIGVPLVIQRNVLAWFAPRRPLGPDQMPCFLMDRRGLPSEFYGFPDVGDGVKAAFHGYGEHTDAAHLDREVHESDVLPLARALEMWIPGAAGAYREGKACMYSLTPDRHFVLDHHPRDARVTICGGFSGHGFKFASAIGEIAAQLALDGGSPLPIAFLSLARF
ncbi:MAG: N-methyl-L-tryptophan oxidase [bacterium]|nr:N-methyl-L-tryptophan oxidase [bacterium]